MRTVIPFMPKICLQGESPFDDLFAEIEKIADRYDLVEEELSAKFELSFMYDEGIDDYIAITTAEVWTDKKVKPKANKNN